MFIKKRFLYLFAFLGLGVLMTSCDVDPEPSDSVDQDRIFGDYELFYNQNEDKTTAKATFRFGNGPQGTPLELVGGSQVTFNGEILTKFTDPVTNTTSYTKEYAGQVPNGTFLWVDADGKQFSNSISMKTIDYPAGLVLMNQDSAYDFVWQGDPLIVDEQVWLWVNGDTLYDAQTFLQGSPGSTNIILEKRKLERLAKGPATLVMDRRYEPEVEEKTSAGGRIVGRYRPTNITVEIQ